MSAVAQALRVAADVLRALPDHELLALALRAEATPSTVIPGPSAAPPTAALREEVAKGTERPTSEAAQRVIDALRKRPMMRSELENESNVRNATLHRTLVDLVERGLVIRPSERGQPWALRAGA